jgi:hypothetical protein
MEEEKKKRGEGQITSEKCCCLTPTRAEDLVRAQPDEVKSVRSNEICSSKNGINGTCCGEMPRFGGMEGITVLKAGSLSERMS